VHASLNHIKTKQNPIYVGSRVTQGLKAPPRTSSQGHARDDDDDYD